MDAQTRLAINRLTQELQRTQRDLARVKQGQRGPQLSHSSIDTGALEVRDGDTVRARIGWLPDGTVGMITEGGDPVSAPTTPTVTPSLGGLRVTWDGTLTNDLTIPGDFDHMAVHVSQTSGFEPDPSTYVGAIRRAGEGGMLPVIPLPYTAHYVRLVPITTSGVQGTPSAQATGTPLQVEGADLTPGSVTAPIIAGGAVTAEKLEAVLALVTTIIAGIPGAARVELDQDGIRGYNTANELIFAIDSSGNAVFSGNITASEISGSRMVIGSLPGNTGVIEDAAGAVRNRVTSSGGQRAQLSATGTGAEFSVWTDPTTPSPAGGMLAQAGVVAVTMQSVSGDFTQPYSQQQVESGRAAGTWRSSSGSGIIIQALPDYSSILLTAPAATDPGDAQGSGYIFTQRYASDIAAVSMQGPVWSAGDGPERGRRSMLHLEGARPERPYTRATQSARRHLIRGEWTGSEYDTTSDGVLDIADTHSISSARHRPLVEELITPPVWTSPTTGSFVDFTSGEWAPITWRTGWSGWVEVTIAAGGLNPNSDGSSLSVGFRLSGGSTVGPALARCAFIRSVGQAFGLGRTASISVPLQLVGVTDYTLTPQWRLSSYNGTDGRGAYFDTSLANRITVRNLT